MALRQDQEEYDQRDFGLQLKEQRRRPDDEKFYEKHLGQVIGMLEYKGNPKDIDSYCEKLAKNEVVVEFKPFKISDDEYKILKILMPKRKINYGRLKKVIDDKLKPIILASMRGSLKSSESVEAYYESTTIVEKLKELQKLMLDSKHSEKVTSMLLSQISESEVKFILYMQPEDQRDIMKDVDYYYRNEMIQEKYRPMSKDVVARRSLYLTQACEALWPIFPTSSHCALGNGTRPYRRCRFTRLINFARLTPAIIACTLCGARLLSG